MDFSGYMAQKLKEARNQSGISAADAGKAVGRSDKTIYAWENNISEPSGEQLIVLCRLYGVNISYFYPNEVTQDSKGNVTLSDIERELIDCLRLSDDEGKQTIMSVARAMRAIRERK